MAVVKGSWLYEVKFLGLLGTRRVRLGIHEGSEMEKTVAQKTSFSYFFQLDVIYKWKILYVSKTYKAHLKNNTKFPSMKFMDKVAI